MRIQNNSKPIIDNVLTSLLCDSVYTKVISTNISDHFFQKISYIISSNETKKVIYIKEFLCYVFFC